MGCTDDGGPTMISPSFGPRAKACDPRSISSASRTPIGRELHAERRRHGLDRGKPPDPGRHERIAQHRHPRYARRELLEQFQPFPAHAEFVCDEAGGVPARPRQALDKPLPTGSMVGDEHNRHRAACLLQRRHDRGGRAPRPHPARARPAPSRICERGRDRPRPSDSRCARCRRRSSRVPAAPARKPRRRRSLGSSAAKLMSTPMRRMRSRCCARAASGHATAAPPISVMKSRRLMCPPGQASQGIVAAQTCTGEGPAMFALGQKRTCAVHQPMSAFDPIVTVKADIDRCLVCSMPIKR